MYEYEAEYEALPELEGEYEYELEAECELEGECEAEEFFGRLAGLARRAASSPQLRRLATTAGRMALRGGMGALGGYLGGQLPPQYRRVGQAAGAGLGYGLGTYLGGLIPESEFEGEMEWESEFEMNPLNRLQQRVHPRALMEHLGHAAAEAESEEEAEAFIGALIPLAARLIPRVAPAVMRAAPQLIRGVSGVTRTLRSNPATRQLVRTVPAIVSRTISSMARQTAQGRPLTPQRAVRTLAQQTAQVIGSPRRSVQAFQRSRALDRQHHRAVGPAAAAVGPSASAPAIRRAGACRNCGSRRSAPARV